MQALASCTLQPFRSGEPVRCALFPQACNADHCPLIWRGSWQARQPAASAASCYHCLPLPYCHAFHAQPAGGYKLQIAPARLRHRAVGGFCRCRRSSLVKVRSQLVSRQADGRAHAGTAAGATTTAAALRCIGLCTAAHVHLHLWLYTQLQPDNLNASINRPLCYCPALLLPGPLQAAPNSRMTAVQLTAWGQACRRRPLLHRPWWAAATGAAAAAAEREAPPPAATAAAAAAAAAATAAAATAGLPG